MRKINQKELGHLAYIIIVTFGQNVFSLSAEVVRRRRNREIEILFQFSNYECTTLYEYFSDLIFEFLDSQTQALIPSISSFEHKHVQDTIILKIKSFHQHTDDVPGGGDDDTDY